MMKLKKNIIIGLMIVVSSLLAITGCSSRKSSNNGNGSDPATVIFESVVQSGGISGTADTTNLVLIFSNDPTTLTADHITVTGATKGTLTGAGTTRTLAISNITVGDGETISVAIANPPGFTITGSPKTAVVYRAHNNGGDPPTTPTVIFESVVQSGGISDTANSTGLVLIFSSDPTTLTADHIAVTGATKGALSGAGITRTLAISDITVGNGETVSVAIANPPGYKITGSPKTAVVYRASIAVVFESVVQSGGISGTADTTGLILTFSSDPTTLTADHITVTGATKGTLTGAGTTRTLAISNITVGDGETISVAIANPPGFTITGSPKTVAVYRALYIGMPYQGGKIAYIFQPGDPGYVPGETHGLIAAIADQSNGIKWVPNFQQIGIGETSTELGAGKENTTKIVDRVGNGSYAAKVCDDYTNPDTETRVYSDWFLPSLDELNKLYLNKAAIGGFDDNNKYWSSTEFGSSRAYTVHFGTGEQDGESSYKGDSYRVRAVRYF